MVSGVIASSESSGKRSSEKRWEAFGRNGSTASRQRSSESRVGSWKIVGASSGGSAWAACASAPAACVVRLIARVLCSLHCMVEAKASTIASTRASTAAVSSPLSSKRFQPGRLQPPPWLASISTTRRASFGSSR